MAGPEAEPEALAFSRESTHVSGKRYVAHLIDGIVFWLLAIVPLVVAAVLSNAALAIVLVFLLIPGPVVYFVLTERRSGRSPGKHLVGIRVVTASGAVPSDMALVKRTLPLIVEYFYIFAWLAMMSSETRQRLGDRWAKTYVIADEAKGLEAGVVKFDLECGLCGERFASEASAKEHVSRLHPDSPDGAVAVVDRSAG